MEKKLAFTIVHIPVKIFYFAFGIIPLLIPVIDSFNKHQEFTYHNNALLYILTLLVCAFLILSLKGLKITLKSEIMLMGGLFFLTLAVRLFWLTLLDTMPVSDFLQAHSVAQMSGFPNVPFANLTPDQIYYKQFPSWGGWMLTLKAVYRVFGAEIWIGQVFNATVSSATVVLIYATVKKMLNSRRVAIIAALIFASWPSMIIYTGVLTGEHSANFACVLSLFFLSSAQQYRDNNFKLATLFYGLAGISAGLLEMYKAVSAILVIAFLIAELFCYWLPDLVSLIKRDLRFAEFFKKSATFGVVFILSYVLFVQTFLLGLGTFVGTKIEPLTYASLYMGLDVETNGQYSLETTMLREKMITDYQDMDRVNNEFKVMLSQKIARDYKQYPELFKKKLEIAWSRYLPETFLFMFAATNRGSTPEEAIYYQQFYNNITNIVGDLSAHYYYVVMFFAAVGSFGHIVMRNNYSVFYCSLYVFGFATVLLLSEVQNRYKTVTYAFLAILAAIGLFLTYSLAEKIYQKISQAYRIRIQKS